jgi:ankyrin repeat protein
MQQLLVLGIPLDTADENNQTALHLALNRNRLDMIKAILADRPRVVCDAADKWGRTILHLACTKVRFK